MLARQVTAGVLAASLLGSTGNTGLRAAAAGTRESAVAGQAAAGNRPESAGARPQAGRLEAEALTEAAARVLFEEKVVRRYPNAWKESLAAKKARGWKHVGRVGAIRVARPADVRPVSRAERYESGDGLVIEYVWDCGRTDSHCSTFYIESYAYGSSISYDVEFVPTGDLAGYCRWAYPIAADPGRDERRQRAGWRKPTAAPTIRLASTGAPAPRQDCPADGFYWRRCMRGCIMSHHENVMIGTAASAGTSLLACFGPTRIDPTQLLLYSGCVAGWSLIGFSLMAVSEFLLSSPCDSVAGGCGPNPC